MLYALSWLLVVSLLVLWSLAAWALHALAVWTVANAGALDGVAAGVAGVRVPEWLAPWVPPEIAQALPALVADLAPVLEGLLQAAPGLAGSLTVAAWVVWGIGGTLLLLLGVGLHVLIAVWKRRGDGSGFAAGINLKGLFR